MKYCPSCQTEYADDTLKFCLQDGTRLTDGAPGYSTVAFGEPETVVRPNAGEKMRFDIGNSGAENVPTRQNTQTSSFQPEPKSSNTALTILLTALGMLVIFGLVGAGAWLYFRKDQSGITQNTNNSTNSANQTFDNDLAKNSNAKKSPTPKTAANASVSNVFPNSANSATPPTIDSEQVKKEVSASLDNWKSQSESRNLNAYMASYADTVDYYKKSGASNSFVRNDKQRAFDKFDTIRVNLSNLSVTPDASGERATVTLDKEWQFSGAESSSSGKVRQQLSLRKIGGKWLITAEKDLKVYYIE